MLISIGEKMSGNQWDHERNPTLVDIASDSALDRNDERLPSASPGLEGTANISRSNVKVATRLLTNFKVLSYSIQ